MTINEKFDELLTLPAGWDSYRARPIDPACVSRAKEIVEHLPDVSFQVVPVGDGGVQIEDTKDSYHYEIEISPNGKYACYLEGDGAEIEITVTGPAALGALLLLFRTWEIGRRTHA